MGKKPRSQRRKKGKSSMEGNGNNGASSGDDDDDLDDDDRRADLLSESFTIADTGSVYSASNFDDDFTAGTYCTSSSSSLLSAAVV
jgi:hypothetical protein